MRLDETIRNLTSGDLVNLLVVIQLGVTRLKKTRVVYLLNLFEGRVEKQKCDLVFRVHLDDWANAGLG